VLLVDTQIRLPNFVVGLQTVGQMPVPEGELVPSMLEADRQCDKGAASIGRAQVAPSRAESLASTTRTGQMFSNVFALGADAIGAMPDMTDTLQRLAEVGAREHWLIDSKEVKLLPDRALGRGGFGVVVLACLRGTAVAVKVPLELEIATSFSHLPSIINELRIFRQIRHANIVFFYGACIDPHRGTLALVFEMVRGERLDVYVMQRMKGAATALRTKLLIDIASALLYLHMCRPCIVHGDVKTSNILVESSVPCPRAKLLDFGLSRLTTKKAKPLGGTRPWMAPELLHLLGAPPPRPKPAADVYSFGLVAYLVICGRSHSEHIDLSALNSPGGCLSLPLLWPANAELVDECRDLCDRCLQIKYTLRPAMCDVQAVLVSWLPKQHVGPEIQALVLDGLSWQAGLDELKRIARGMESGGPPPPLGSDGASSSPPDATSALEVVPHIAADSVVGAREAPQVELEAGLHRTRRSL